MPRHCPYGGFAAIDHELRCYTSGYVTMCVRYSERAQGGEAGALGFILFEVETWLDVEGRGLVQIDTGHREAVRYTTDFEAAAAEAALARLKYLVLRPGESGITPGDTHLYAPRGVPKLRRVAPPPGMHGYDLGMMEAACGRGTRAVRPSRRRGRR